MFPSFVMNAFLKRALTLLYNSPNQASVPVSEIHFFVLTFSGSLFRISFSSSLFPDHFFRFTFPAHRNQQRLQMPARRCIQFIKKPVLPTLMDQRSACNVHRFQEGQQGVFLSALPFRSRHRSPPADWAYRHCLLLMQGEFRA